MRVFLCSFADFSVAIPMHSVSSVVLYTDKEAQKVENNQEHRNTYISLPQLFNLQCEDIRHGIILKSGEDNIEEKIILLTTEVECETEIPNEEIFPIPKVLSNKRFAALFNGIRFGSQQQPMLILNPEQLLKNTYQNKFEKEMKI